MVYTLLLSTSSLVKNKNKAIQTFLSVGVIKCTIQYRKCPRNAYFNS